MNRPKTFKRWLTNRFEHNELADMCKYGCVNGFSGLVFYSETTALYQTYKDEIWELLLDEADNVGDGNIFAMLNRCCPVKHCGSADQFENFLVWLAAETIAWQLTEGEYK